MTETEPYPVDQLWVDSVGTRPVWVDWQERWNDGDGWTSYEAPSCPECGEYAVWDDDAEEWRCPKTGCDLNLSKTEIDPHENGAEGPMMNYYYPLEDIRRSGDDPYEAATRIRDLPLCVIEWEDGTYALALTGGGMDLSWEICEAFTRLGYLPPLHFCDLPTLAGKKIDARTRYVIDACLRTTAVAASWAQDAHDRLVSTYGEA